MNTVLMRQIVSLSLSKKQVAALRKLSVQRGYKNVSQYVADLIDMDSDVITEAELLRSVKEADAEYKAGKAIHANSLLELL